MLNSVTPSSVLITTFGVVPRIPIVATGVSIFMLPVGAMAPVTKTNDPWTRLITIELSSALAGS